MIRHVVLFSWKDETPEERIHEIERAFTALKNKIDCIADFEWELD